MALAPGVAIGIRHGALTWLGRAGERRGPAERHGEPYTATILDHGEDAASAGPSHENPIRLGALKRLGFWARAPLNGAVAF